MRTTRIIESDTEIDKLENGWWDNNADTIEKIWAQNIHFQKIIRLPYLKKMKSFFLNGNPKTPIKILEVGCGTGWVCRLVADENFHVVGTDFSRGQLRIANEMAKIFDKEKYCTYELADASSFSKEIDGVVIHALLHHLTKKELELFFEEFSKLSAGTKIFIYEPVFFKKQQKEPTLRDKVINKLIFLLKDYALKEVKKNGKEDKDLVGKMNTIYNDAEKYGWFISPKEVPFEEGELEAYLQTSCILKRKYIVNKTDLDIAQALSMHGIQKPSFLFSKVIIPLSIWLDKLSFTGNFTNYIYPNQHLFVCFELIKK